MKKSEMLRKLNFAIQCNYGCVQFPMNLNELLELFLETAEDNGILPELDVMCDCEDCGGRQFGWEKE